MTHRIQCWSGPRNLSTALMYSFRQRGDTTVVDEPLYTHFLAVSDRPDPGREATLASRSSDQHSLVRELILGPCPTPVLYVKQISSHLLGIDRWFLDETDHVLLTREPRAVLASFARHLPEATLADTGLPAQVELLDDLLDRGRDPVVVDADRLVDDPRAVLQRLCERLGLDFDPAMLTWPTGPKPEDGAWAPYWYANVHRSSRFERQRAEAAPLPTTLEPTVDEARPLHERLLGFAV